MNSIHLAALDRRRQLVLQEDANVPFEAFRLPFDRWLDFRFRHVDAPGSQIDGIWWDIGFAEDTYACYESRILPRVRLEGFDDWCSLGIDWPGELVRTCHARGLEAFWNNRVCPVDFPQPMSIGLRIPHNHPSRINPVKQAHPDWVIPCWWPQGLWNLAVADVRQRKVAILRELLERYPLDGIQLDFARHTPCLPIGREWELRHHVTAFVTMVREMMLEVEKRTGHARLLAVRIGETVEGNHRDGFEVERWTGDGLVDILTLGGRTISIDVAGFKEIARGLPVRLCACFDGHHTTDGYYFPDMDYYRAVFRNFHLQGVDTISLFNWACAPPEAYDEFGLPGMMKCASHSEAVKCAGDPATLGGNRLYTVERRGGYPWAQNFVYRNDDRPLPCNMPCTVPFDIFDDVAGDHSVESTALYVVIRKAVPTSYPRVCLNGQLLPETARNADWKDGQIYGDKPQPSSGAASVYAVEDPQQHLLRLEFAVNPHICRPGRNEVSVVPDETSPGKDDGRPIVEKVELAVRFPPS